LEIKVAGDIDLTDLLLGKKGKIPGQFKRPLGKTNVVEPNFGTRVEAIDYSNMGMTNLISEADSSHITSLCSLNQGYFATASSAGVIKVWDPLQVSPIASISDENAQIEFMVTYRTK
jgi:WD40 repeat protein